MNYIRKFLSGHKLNNVIYFIFYMLVCFPFVGVNLIGSDTQPWALLMAIAIVGYAWFFKGIWYSNTYTNLLLAFLLYCIVVGVCSIWNMSSFSSMIRSGANYATVCFVTIAAYYVMKAQGGLRENWIKCAVLIWFVVGFMQKYFDSQFGYALLPHARTTAERGVIGLSSEPSFYGYMCVFFIVIAMDFKKHRLFYMAINLVEILLFAQSSVAVVYLAIFAAAYVLVGIVRRDGIGYRALAIALGLYAILSETIDWLSSHFQNRFFQMLYKIFYNKKDLMYDDSVSSRLDSITSSVKGSIDWAGFPHGFSSVRIMSGYGAMLYELGIVGVIMMILFFQLMAKNKNSVFIAIGMSVVLFSAVQLANPFFSFYLGYCMYQKSIRDKWTKGDATI